MIVTILEASFRIDFNPEVQLATITRLWPNGLMRDVTECTIDEVIEVCRRIRAERDRTQERQRGNNV